MQIDETIQEPEAPVDAAALTFFAGEMQLAGWGETHNGGCKVTFWLADPEDLEKFRHLTTAKGKQAGQRIYAALVLLDDGEEPVPGAVVSSAGKRAALGPLCSEAVGFCQRPDFMLWLTRGTAYATTAAGARQALHSMLKISSRKELDENPDAAQRWGKIKADFYRRTGGFLDE